MNKEEAPASPQTAETFVTPAPTDQPAAEAKAPAVKIDRSRSLASQADAFLKAPVKEQAAVDDAAATAIAEATGEPKAEATAEVTTEPEVIPAADPTPAEEVTPPVKQELALPELDNVAEPAELPAITKYILDNLPVIQVVGHQTDGVNKTYNVKRLEDLPDDFEFASRRGELAFMRAEAANELNARDLARDYQNKQAQAQMQTIQRQDAADIRRDLATLQKDGILGTFQYEPSDPRYETDPAVMDANAIYKVWQDTNDAYIKSGRVNKITFLDAADKYYAAKYRAELAERNKTPEPVKEETPKPTPQRSERQRVASRATAPQTTVAERTAPKARSGMTFQDILRLSNQGRI